MERLKLAMVFAVACGVIAGYGVWQKLHLGRVPQGVSCYTGRFPALKPVNLR